MISLDDPDQPYIQPIIQGFRERLTRAPGAPTLDVEFFDQVRFGDRQAYADEFIEWLHRKYRRDRLDLIVATQQQTLQLLAKRPGSPWNDLPVVYGSLGNLTIDISQTHPTASGVVIENFYFSEPEPRGLSRLECYRRLLGQPDATQLPAARPLNSGGPRVARLRRLADVLDLGGRNRRVHG